MAAVIAVDSGEALLQVATVQEAGEDLLLHRAGKMTTGLEFLVMAGDALIQRARPGMAGPVNSAGNVARFLA